MDRIADIPSAFVDTMFDPVAYNTTYFSEIMQDEAAVLDWLVARLPGLLHERGVDDMHLLDAGCGPTIHRMIAFEPFVASMTLADLMIDNLAEIDRWRDREVGAHDWSHFTTTIQRSERLVHRRSDHASTCDREASVRRKISGLASIDLRRAASLCIRSGAAPRREFDVVTSFFCADSATADLTEFELMLGNAAGYVRPGGWFIGSCLGGCSAYRVGEHWLPSAQLHAVDIAAAVHRAGVDLYELTRFATPELGIDGFDHIYVFSGVRR